MYCPNCGEQIDDKAVVCPKCGVPVKNTVAPDDAPSTGFAVLGFLFPIIGLILYLVWKSERPLRAKSVGKGRTYRISSQYYFFDISLLYCDCSRRRLLRNLLFYYDITVLF